VVDTMWRVKWPRDHVPGSQFYLRRIIGKPVLIRYVLVCFPQQYPLEALRGNEFAGRGKNGNTLFAFDLPKGLALDVCVIRHPCAWGGNKDTHASLEGLQLRNQLGEFVEYAV